MNKQQLDNIKALTKDLRWKDVEELLRSEIVDMLDMRTLDKTKDIEKQVYGRIEYAETLIKFLKKVKMISNEPVSLKPKTYI